MARCEKTDLLETECAHCLGHITRMAKAEPNELKLITRWLPATWDTGRCNNCKRIYHEGELVAKAETIGWIAKDCCGDA